MDEEMDVGVTVAVVFPCNSLVKLHVIVLKA